ncbi:MAG: aldolase/citrate lyase family protein [Dongiaceae bacterium]
MVGTAPGPAIAFWLEQASLPACEIAAAAGYRAVILDREHGVIGEPEADALSFACRGLGLAVYWRVAALSRAEIQHALDAGVDAVILPQIADLAEARAASALAKYPPLGSRGVGYSRTMGYGGTGPDFFAAENRRTGCWCMIETPGALADAAAIAALPTVDGLFVGPSDLSMSRGRGPYRQTDADRADIAAVAAAAAAAGKPWGMPAPGAAMFAFARGHGAVLLTVCDDLSALGLGFAQALKTAGL